VGYREANAIGPGSVVAGRYEILDEAGRGGMAVVWRAKLCGDAGFSRTVAIKQMYPYLAREQVYIDMFIEEARIGAQLADSNIAQAYDFVVEDGQYFLIMEWVEGIDLGSFVHHFAEQGVKPRWELVVAIGVGLLRGLAAAHERVDAEGRPTPVVHRDVSPHNILLTVEGKVKLIDFGLALADDRQRELTDPGVVKGKMCYLSPEVVGGRRPTPASDQFATGSVLWEALIGRKLFDGRTDFETYTKLRDGQVQPLRPLRPELPSGLVATINRSLSLAEEQRFESTRDMARELGSVLKGVKERRDLHVALGRAVAQARASSSAARRADHPSVITPIVDLSSDFVLEERLAESAPGRRGLWHRMPFLGRGR
jgi:serine/threonine-protein kinase